MAVLFSSYSVSAADAPDGLQLQMSPKVIYCAAKLKVDQKTFLLPLQDGTVVATQWSIKVSQVRDYWLNENIAEITVMRRVEPDLLTRSWLLVDVSSGISLRVHDIHLVMDFLTHLRKFPMLDRSLLMDATPYRAEVRIQVYMGEDTDETWWSSLWSSSATLMQKDFTLP